MIGKFLFLGSGGSLGIPIVGCQCSICTSDNSANKRLRPSGLVTLGEKKFLIDAGPDFRTQCLTNKITDIDGVILTHAHHDHTAGVDELRVFYLNNKKPMPTLLSKETADDLKIRYAYLFKEPIVDKFVARLDLQILENRRGPVTFEGTSFHYFSFEQSGMAVNGFRFGELAYMSDIFHYPETIFEDLKGVQTLIISALRYTKSPMHFSVDQAIEFSKRVNPKMTWFTHISHELDYEKTNAYLPPNIRLAYDGLEFQFEAGLYDNKREK